MTYRDASTLSVVVAGLLFCAGCQHMTIHRVAEDSDELAINERPLGFVAYDEVRDDEIPGYHVRLYKIHKGYAAKARLQNEDKQAFDFVMSRDKEKDWFTGLQMKWVF